MYLSGDDMKKYTDFLKLSRSTVAPPARGQAHYPGAQQGGFDRGCHRYRSVNIVFNVVLRWVPLANLIQFQPGETIFFTQN
jgi:hypothetical protein